MACIELEGVCREFGGVRAVDDLNMAVDSGEVVSLIGPNGAGKTTALNLISGYYRPTLGTVRFEGQVLNGKGPHERALAGLQRTFQNLQICFNMTARENVMLGAHQHLSHGVLASIVLRGRIRSQTRAAEQRADELMARVGLSSWSHREAAEMPYGALKRLEIARALAARPKALLLDEPAAGLNPNETHDMERLIRGIADEGVAVILVEHDMKLVMSISDRIVVLNFGKRLAEGRPQDVRSNPEVVRAYIGGEL